MAARNSSALPLSLAGTYTLLVAYGSLYPLAAWHVAGVDAFAYLAAGWPRYVTGFDIVANVIAYLPLGFLWATLLLRRLPPAVAFVAATLAGTLLSLGLETAQNYLPSRVPSNLDLVCNSVGAMLGAAAGLRWGWHLLDGGRLQAWRARRFLRGSAGDIGLLLVALWFLTQLNPETFLFGSGNLRGLFGLPATLPFAAGHFLVLEMATVASQTLAIALIGARLAIHRPLLLPAVLLVTALGVKSFALLVLMEGMHGLAWATPGSLAGLALGVALWLAAVQANASTRQAIAALALMFATALANLMPANPYFEDTLRVWQQGHFLNFNGLTRLATALWPFFALSWLMFSRSRH